MRDMRDCGEEGGWRGGRGEKRVSGLLVTSIGKG